MFLALLQKNKKKQEVRGTFLALLPDTLEVK